MQQEHTSLWRKIWSNTALIEPGKPFSRLEAWLYITNVLAAPIDDQASGLKRGEFVASVRELAKCFHWSIGAAHRFLKTLLQNSIIMRVVLQAEHLERQEAGHFTVCNYDTYNLPRNTSWNMERNTEGPAGREAEYFSVCNQETYSPPRYTRWDNERQGVRSGGYWSFCSAGGLMIRRVSVLLTMRKSGTLAPISLTKST